MPEPQDAGPSRTPLSSLLSLKLVLEPEVVEAGNLAVVKGALHAGRLVVVRDAFRKQFADRVHRALWDCQHWKPYEGAEGNFHYRHHNLYEKDQFPPELTECGALFSAEDTKGFIAELSGRDCSGPALFSASWYMPLDYSLPHEDAVGGPPVLRQVSYLWHLTKDWDPRWGGHLYWGPAQRLMAPSFNTLYLFNVGPSTQHFVAPVAPNAAGKRLTVNGWWQGATPYPPAEKEPETSGRVEVI